MTTKLEQIARAICSACGDNPSIPDSLNWYGPAARAAVEAFRDPPPCVQAAMMEAWINTASFEIMFDAMIRAVLNEKPRPYGGEGEHVMDASE